jgi:hypothetical protein
VRARDVGGPATAPAEPAVEVSAVFCLCTRSRLALHNSMAWCMSTSSAPAAMACRRFPAVRS